MRVFRYRVASVTTFTELAEGMTWFARYDRLNDPFEGSYVNRTASPVFDKLIQQFRVCCFSRKHDSLLLWAHYSDNHRGLCLEYEVSDDTYRTQFFPTRYRKALPSLDEVRTYPPDSHVAGALIVHEDREAAVFLTKSEEWSYEEEVRTLRHATDIRSEGEKYPVPGELSAVYFGLRADPSTIVLIDRLLYSQPHVEFFQASLVQGQFKLVFAPVMRGQEVPKTLA